MSTWNDLRDQLRRTYKLQDDEGSFVSMVWDFDGGRSQKVVIRQFHAFDREMVEIKSAFTRDEDIDPRDLLARNAELPLGTIALSGSVYMVVYNTPVTHLVWADMELFIGRVAAVADALEERYGAGDAF